MVTNYSVKLSKIFVLSFTLSKFNNASMVRNNNDTTGALNLEQY